MVNKRFLLLAYALLTPIFLFVAWPTANFVPFLFIAFVPMFLLDNKLEEGRKTGFYYLYLYLAMFLYNLATTWWVWNASIGGAIFMLLANSLLMTLPFMAYRFTRKVLGINRALAAFVLYWLSFEYIHFRWDLTYPWLTLGNAFAGTTDLIQWYEYTGVLGGTLWVLMANVLIYRWYVTTNRNLAIWSFALLIVPIGWSLFLAHAQGCQKEDREIVVVQPNIDPYEKFNGGNEADQLRVFFALAEKELTAETELVVLPETAIVEYMDEDNFDGHFSMRFMQGFAARHPNLKILTGASTYRFFKKDEKPSATARLHEGSGQYYDSYNTALLIDSTGVLDVYHKSKLVPGTEKMPYPGFFKILGPMAIDLGGISGSLGVDTASKVFFPHTDTNTLNPAPLICYESIFGEYVTTFVHKKANILFVITNDGWWGDTPGYRQHKDYARLRAIETRRYVVRAANTGISCVIDDNGEVLQETKWWEAVAFNTKVKALNYTTFYTKHGDYIGRIAAFVALFLLLSVWVKSKIK